MRSVQLVFLCSLLLLVPVAPITSEVITEPRLKLGLVIDGNPVRSFLLHFMATYEGAGHKTYRVNSSLPTATAYFDDSTANATDMDILIMSGNRGFPLPNLKMLKDWFYTGNKLLVYAGDSDLYDDLSPIANNFLESMESSIRLDDIEVYDSSNRVGSKHKFFATNPGAGNLSQGVFTTNTTSVFFDGTTAIYAVNGTESVDLRTTNISNVEILLSTSENATVGEFDPFPDGYYTTLPTTGNYPLVVAEKFGSSMLVLMGEALFSEELYSDEPVDGRDNQAKTVMNHIIREYYSQVYNSTSAPEQQFPITLPSNILNSTIFSTLPPTTSLQTNTTTSSSSTPSDPASVSLFFSGVSSLLLVTYVISRRSR